MCDSCRLMIAMAALVKAHPEMAKDVKTLTMAEAHFNGRAHPTSQDLLFAYRAICDTDRHRPLVIADLGMEIELSPMEPGEYTDEFEELH